MTKHMTGTREEWLAARLGLLKAEKELTRRGDELARRRQELPWVRIDKEYSGSTAPPRGATRRASGGAATMSTSRFLRTPARVATRRMRACEHAPLLPDNDAGPRQRSSARVALEPR